MTVYKEARNVFPSPAVLPHLHSETRQLSRLLRAIPWRSDINKALKRKLGCSLRRCPKAGVEHWNDLKFERGTKLLKDLSTWGIGVPCDYFVQVFNPTQLVSAVRFCQENAVRFIVIGSGSNCLFDDLGFEGCVILNRIDFFERIGPGNFRVGSGYKFNRLGLQCSYDGFTGLEFAGGIPGTVGGAVYMNAGANGQETADVIDSVDILTTDYQLCRFSKNELEFGYRSSPFQEFNNLAAIVEATFRLQSSGSARTKQLEYLERRKISQPICEKTAGSVFQNPRNAGVSAAKLIEEAGLKELRVGGAMVSKLHANFFVNVGGSTSQDMLDLIDLVKGEVTRKFDIKLEEEISYIRPCN